MSLKDEGCFTLSVFITNIDPICHKIWEKLKPIIYAMYI